MSFHRLSWRVGVPFVLLVLLETVALAVFLGMQAAAEERTRLEQVANANARFIETSSLDTSEELARHLSKVSGYRVFFRRYQMLEPVPSGDVASLPLESQPPDERAHQYGTFECVAVPIPRKSDLLLVREVRSPWLDPRVHAVLAAFLLLAILAAWLVVRGLVRPLAHLASQLPQIETAGPLALPEASRQDEIGDLARAFVRTRQALHDERQARDRMEKLAVLGRMTAALAHEVQNPVAAIRMHAQLLRHADPDAATTIEHEALRIEGLLNQWLFLTRPDPPAIAEVDVGALLARIVAMHQVNARHAAVALRLEAPAGLLAAADSRRLEQVFRNLLTNALQAMPGGGTLAITAERAGELLRVRFQDTGGGFSATALHRFAEFFFSEREGGMGIGLSVASEIVKAHGGVLRVANTRAGGAEVTVELPAAAPVARAAAAGAPRR